MSYSKSTLLSNLLSMYLFSVLVSSAGMSLSRTTGIHFIDFLKRFFHLRESVKACVHMHEQWEGWGGRGRGRESQSKAVGEHRAQQEALSHDPGIRAEGKPGVGRLTQLCHLGVPTSLIFICQHLFVYLKSIYLILGQHLEERGDSITESMNLNCLAFLYRGEYSSYINIIGI